jgi:hypothetical protein
MNAEKQLQNAIITWLECQGAYVVSVKSGKLMAMYGGKVRMIHLAPAGTPDVHVCWNGRPLYIELKKDEATAESWHRVVDRFIETGVCAKSNLPIITQHQCHKRIIRAGGEVIVCGSLEELQHDVQTLGFIPTPHSHDGAKKHQSVHSQKASLRKERGKKESGKNSGRIRRKESAIGIKAAKARARKNIEEIAFQI